MNTTLGNLAEIVSGKASGDLNKIIRGVGPFDNATEDHITYAGSSALLKKLDHTGAGAIIVPHGFNNDSKNLILVDNPRAAFAKALQFFYPRSRAKTGISKDAHIGVKFVCGDNVSIAPFAAIGDNVVLGDRVTIQAGVVIKDNVVIRNDVEIFPNVTIHTGAVIGSRVTIQAGAVIGSHGFGYEPDGKKYLKIIHRGTVQIDDDVEIGANNTIDRAVFGKTHICKGVKTDNLVHIAHNVTVGENTIIVAQAGIAGSVKIGKHVILAGQSGIAQHLTIGDNAIVGPKSGVAKSVPDRKGVV